MKTRVKNVLAGIFEMNWSSPTPLAIEVLDTFAFCCIDAGGRSVDKNWGVGNSNFEDYLIFNLKIKVDLLKKA